MRSGPGRFARALPGLLGAGLLGSALLMGCAVDSGAVDSGGLDSDVSQAGPPGSSPGASRAPGTTDAHHDVPIPTPVLVTDVTWRNLGGGPVLIVTPASLLRDNPRGSWAQAAWRQVVRQAPQADTQTMWDQFRCHVQFAPRKAQWYLEANRPAVGYLRTVLAGCNPGDVKDAG